jgi:hypothetical protein
MTTAIIATRSAIGLSCWATPVLASRLFGLDISRDVSGSFYLRLGGTRDFALAASAATLKGSSRKQALRIAAACDLGDMAAALIARRHGHLSDPATGVWLAASAACLALTVAAIEEDGPL